MHALQSLFQITRTVRTEASVRRFTVVYKNLENGLWQAWRRMDLPAGAEWLRRGQAQFRGLAKYEVI